MKALTHEQNSGAGRRCVFYGVGTLNVGNVVAIVCLMVTIFVVGLGILRCMTNRPDHAKNSKKRSYDGQQHKQEGNPPILRVEFLDGVL